MPVEPAERPAQHRRAGQLAAVIADNHSWQAALLTRRSSSRATRTPPIEVSTTQARHSRLKSDRGQDYVRLNFGRDLAAAMFVGDRGCDVAGRRFQSFRVSGLDFVAQQSSLAIGNGGNAR